MDKQLKEKAIQFKGKNYVLISDRVNYFNETYPNGSIQTILVSEPNSKLCIFKAIVIPDIKENRIFTGYSQASFDDSKSLVNKTSALENAETSSVGRALALMGIGVIDSIASMDEINKTTYNSPQPVKQTIPVKTNTDISLGNCVKCGAPNKLSMQGKKYCSKLCWQKPIFYPDKVEEEFTAF